MTPPDPETGELRPNEVPIQSLIFVLSSEGERMPDHYLLRLSDLEGDDLKQFQQAWSSFPVWRRRALMEDLATLAESDLLLSFENVGRLALQDEDANVRFGGILTLMASECVKSDLIAVYTKMMESDPDPAVRSEAAAALGPYIYDLEMEDLPQRFKAGLEDSLLGVANGNDQPFIRRRAMESVAFATRDEVNTLIQQAYQSNDIEWRASAVAAMGRSLNERWAAQVLESLDSEHPTVQVEAVRAAGELSLTDAKPALIRLSGDDIDETRLAALWSLSQIGGKDVQALLKRNLKRARNEDEITFLEEALENYAFNADLEAFGMLDIENMDEEELENAAYSVSADDDPFDEDDELIFDNYGGDDEDEDDDDEAGDPYDWEALEEQLIESLGEDDDESEDDAP